jgi:hypothetical protein
MVFLPTQARDKHRETQKQRRVFLGAGTETHIARLFRLLLTFVPSLSWEIIVFCSQKQTLKRSAVAYYGPGPKGTHLIADFESPGGGGQAWPNATLVSGGANGSKSGMKIHCPANSTLTSRRPLSAAPNLDHLTFDSVLEYDHILFWFKVSADYTNSALSQDFPFAINASTSIGNSAPLGHFKDRHVGTDGGNLHSNAVAMIDQTQAQQLNETTNDNSIWMSTVLNASASTAGSDVGGGLRCENRVSLASF